MERCRITKVWLPLKVSFTFARRDPKCLGALLHADFVEIGRSGRRWDRQSIISMLISSKPDAAAAVADSWEFQHLAPHVVLIIYRLRRGSKVSRHSSIWDTSTDPAKLRFHQGTIVPVED